MPETFTIDAPQRPVAACAPLHLRAVLSALALVALVAIAYLPLNHAGFIWDDNDYLLNNLALGKLRGLYCIWFHPLIAELPQYYPLTFTTFWVEFHLFGLNPLAFHVTNVVLHTLSSIVLWRLLRRLQVPGSWFVAALFAVHPVHVESVAWISERKNCLSGLLYLLSLSAYLRFLPRHWGWYAASLGLFVLSLWSKSVTSSLPVVVLLILYWKRGSIGWRDIWPLIPFFVFGGAMGIVTSWMEKHIVGAVGPEWNITYAQRILIASHALWFYAGKLFWPYPLIFTYPRWDIYDPNLLQIAYPLGLVAVIGLLWIYRQKLGRGPLVAVLFFAITLFPALGFVDLYPMRYSFVADHFQYIASIGLLALAVGAGVTTLRRFAPHQPRAGQILAGGILVLLVSATFARGFAFRDLKSLWRDTLAKNPNAWMAHNNMGVALFDSKDYDGSLAEFRAAAALNPDDVEAWLNTARMELFRGTLRDAVAMGSHGLSYVDVDNSSVSRARRARGWFIIGCALFREGDERGCEAAFWLVVANDPNYLAAHAALAEMLEDQRDWRGAIKEWQIVERLGPKYLEAHQMLAPLYAAQGRYDLSTKELHLAMSLNRSLAAQIDAAKSAATPEPDR
jgi:hypothetical protein